MPGSRTVLKLLLIPALALWLFIGKQLLIDTPFTWWSVPIWVLSAAVVVSLLAIAHVVIGSLVAHYLSRARV